MDRDWEIPVQGYSAHSYCEESAALSIMSAHLGYNSSAAMVEVEGRRWRSYAERKRLAAIYRAASLLSTFLALPPAERMSCCGAFGSSQAKARRHELKGGRFDLAWNNDK